MTELYQLVPGVTGADGASFSVRRIAGKPYMPSISISTEIVRSRQRQVSRSVELLAAGYREIGEYQLERGATTLVLDTTGSAEPRYERTVALTSHLVLFESITVPESERFIILDLQTLTR